MNQILVRVPDEIAEAIRAQPNQSEYVAKLVARELGITLPDRALKGRPSEGKTVYCKVCNRKATRANGLHLKCERELERTA